MDGRFGCSKRVLSLLDLLSPTLNLVVACSGLNLIGANRLVLFDPDWNPAVGKFLPVYVLGSGLCLEAHTGCRQTGCSAVLA